LKTACVILAAGLGKRMNSSVPKVLHKICGATMLQCVLDAAGKLNPDRIVVVAGKDLKLIRQATGSAEVVFALQDEPKGTGHALSCARFALKRFNGDIVVINGDTPLIGQATIKRFLRLHRKDGNVLSVLSFTAEKPANYGRMVRDGSGRLLSIIEDKDAGPAQKAIHEVNSGVYAIHSSGLHLLDAIKMNRSKKEYYLTDIVAEASVRRLKIGAHCIGTEEEFMGVNTKEELYRASLFMKKRITDRWIEGGVSFVDPNSVFIDAVVTLGKGTIIYPNVHLEGDTHIGRGTTIYPNVRIRSSRIGDGVVIKDSTVIEDSLIKGRACVGPFAHVRPGSEIGKRARVGNFVELKKAFMGDSSKASHLSYLGDARIGKGVNIGAGTITCNYDGITKQVTAIDDGVFVGSDTQLVAPVKIGKGAYIGAGSTITKDVPPWSLALSRAGQKIIKDWAKKRKLKVRNQGSKR
jgi:bifunctional UDP-N-acetylglucosamine pyrophosphorylase/glucosamine-1-phosphate N-acetyltransferase